jgi:sterol desaturase/sphingolipid hydroxylase (fatty acid hydroxylase superfamily)
MTTSVALRAAVLFVSFVVPYWGTCFTWRAYRYLSGLQLAPAEAEAWTRGCRSSLRNTLLCVPLLCWGMAMISDTSSVLTGCEWSHQILCVAVISDTLHYVLHRAAHGRSFYWVHKAHHKSVKTVVCSNASKQF